jgi:hypothetical protein
MPQHGKPMHLKEKEAVLVDHKLAAILKKLGLGMPENMNENKEAVVVDPRIGELIKALNIGKDQKMTAASHHALTAL